MDTTALRVLAILLIANSHLENLYPFRPLAADGLIGNSLFFLLSGLGLALSPRTMHGSLTSWYGRRLRRIYPALWLTVIVGSLISMGAWRDWRTLDYLKNFFWPTPYGFVSQIVLFYPAFYALKRACSRRLEVVVLVVLAVAYAVFAMSMYNLHVLSWIFSFQVMILGGLAAGRVNTLVSQPRRDLAWLCIALVGYIGIKLAMVTGRLPTNVVPQHLMTLVILDCLLRLNASATVQSWIRRPVSGRCLGLIGGITLEVYLVHGFIYESAVVSVLRFPLNIAAFWCLTVPVAWLLATVTDQIMSRLIGDSKKPEPKIIAENAVPGASAVMGRA